MKVCCVFVCVSAMAAGLTVSPAESDLVSMINFLADGENGRSDVSSISSARCGAAPHHTATPITAVYQHMYVHLQIQKCTHKHMRMHAHTHTHTCLQSPPHGCAQSAHFRVALDVRDDVTDKEKGVPSAFLIQVQM